MKHRFFILVACIAACLTVKAQDVSSLANLYDTQKYPELIQKCTQQLQKYPQAGIVYWYRALGYEQQGELGRALQDANAAIQYIKSIKKGGYMQSGIYLLRSEIYQAIGDTVKAMNDLNMAVKVDPKVANVYVNRGNLYLDMNQYDKALEDYNIASKLDPNNENVQELIARCYFIKGEDELAYNKYSVLVKLYPSNSRIWFSWAICNAYRGDKEVYIDAYIRYINIYYAQTGQFVNSEDLTDEGREKNTCAYLLRAVTREVNTVTDDNLQSFWKQVKARVYMKAGNYKEALVDLNALGLDNVFVWSNRAECYMNLYQYRNAITDYTACINAYPDYADAYSNRGICYQEIGQFDNAIADFTYVINNFPENAYFAYYLRGWVYEFKGDTVSAMSDYNRGIELQPDHAYTYLMRGTLYLDKGDTAKANADFEHIIAVDTIVWEGSCRQYALHFMGQDNEAVEWMQQIVALNPEDAGHYYDLACVYSLLNRTDEALDALDMAFKKGYRSFVHIEYDDDMNNIRNLPRFTEIVNKYRQEGIMQKFKQFGDN